MADIIRLLPDNIANQIAAGEVIQRPASAVKELLENAVDAGATEIRLIIKDAGKELVQVIDNGCGMSETDVRMSFERHATSKIASIDDLFHIKTMGFRGEALASIAAVSQVEVKTRKHDAELGTFIEIDNSIVKKQEACQCEPGTSFAMKNLFFNVPARRNFLKANSTEMRHIIDEFTRVALSFPDIFFSLVSNGQQLFHLEGSSLKQRIVNITTSSVQSKLVTVKEETDYMNIYGFAGKPEAARKTRGEQYFFVNNRFIKSAYLNHAVMNAYSNMIPADSYPLYVLFIDLNPEHVDINVHPTKQEIKFEDEKVIYAFVLAAVKHALAQFSISPTLDFDVDAGIQQLPSVSQPFTEKEKSRSESSSIYQGFTRQHQAHFIESKQQLPHWKDIYGEPKREAAGTTTATLSSKLSADTGSAEKSQETEDWYEEQEEDKKLPVQLHQRYMLTQLKSGFILIDQRLAHERILFDRYRHTLSDKAAAMQQSLFPQTVKLQSADAALLTEMLSDLRHLGYELEPFGKDTFIVQGTPADIEGAGEQASIEGLLEEYKHFNNSMQLSQREKLVHSLARNNAIPHGKILLQKEMQHLIDQLFACEQPNYSPAGKPVFLTFKLEDLAKMFNN